MINFYSRSRSFYCQHHFQFSYFHPEFHRVINVETLKFPDPNLSMQAIDTLQKFLNILVHLGDTPL